MDIFLEIFKIIGICIGTLILLFACAEIQCRILTEEEMADHADFMDEFLYGEKFR